MIQLISPSIRDLKGNKRIRQSRGRLNHVSVSYGGILSCPCACLHWSFECVISRLWGLLSPAVLTSARSQPLHPGQLWLQADSVTVRSMPTTTIGQPPLPKCPALTRYSPPHISIMAIPSLPKLPYVHLGGSSECGGDDYQTLWQVIGERGNSSSLHAAAVTWQLFIQ